LEFGGAEDSFDLKRAKFEEVPPQDVPFSDRDRFLRFLEISLADGTRLLLAECLPSCGQSRLCDIS
jgi:hypothetical protein